MALFLALYLAAFSGRPLTVTLLCGVRTFLPPPPEDEDQRLSGLLHGRYCTLPRRVHANKILEDIGLAMLPVANAWILSALGDFLPHQESEI